MAAGLLTIFKRSVVYVVWKWMFVEKILSSVSFSCRASLSYKSIKKLCTAASAMLLDAGFVFITQIGSMTKSLQN